MFVDFHILNELGSPSINSNTFANRPPAGQIGRLFVSTDTYEIYRDNGSTWDLIGGPGSSTVTGTGAATQVAYWTASQAIGGSNNLWWDNTNTRLGVGTAAPSGLIHADGGASAARMILDADAGVARIFSFRSDNLPRWAFRVDGAETGSNAGADLAVRAYNDAGAFTFAPLTIARSTGKANWQATEAYTTGLARGNYFDYNLSVSAGGSFSSPNSISAVGATLDLTLAGNATIPSGARSGLDAYNTVSFTGTGTLTHSQGTQIRAYSNLTTGWAFAGSATGTITHLAGLRVLFPDNSGSAVTITNNYGLLINDQTANTGTVTYTNRWGVYQEGASDINYFAANTLIGTTTNSGQKLVVNGTSLLTGQVSIAASFLQTSSGIFRIENTGISAPTGSTGLGIELFKSGTISYIESYNRTSNAYEQLNFRGSSLGFTGAASFNNSLSSADFGSFTNYVQSTDGTAVVRCQIQAGAGRIVMTDGRVGGYRYDLGPVRIGPGTFCINDSTSGGAPPRFTIWPSGNITIGASFVDSGNKLNIEGDIKTNAPTTGTAGAWKLGSRVAAAVVLDATQYIEVEVDGTFYKLAIVT